MWSVSYIHGKIMLSFTSTIISLFIGDSKKKKSDKEKSKRSDKDNDENRKNSDKSKDDKHSKQRSKEEKSDGVISKDSLGVVTQTNGLKLHIKIERPPSADSDRSKTDAKPDKKRASTVKRPNTKFRSTGRVIWHAVAI